MNPARTEPSPNILLSICIPTFNRASYLNQTLSSIVNQPCFDQRCEVIISDNNSDDGTREMVLEDYSSKYGNVRYYRNDKNIEDANVIKVMDEARGTFIKLHSDKFCFLDNKLCTLLHHLTNFDGNAVFLLNEETDSIEDYAVECKDLDMFVRQVSFYSTWLPGMIFRNAVYRRIENRMKYAGSYIPQTGILFQILGAMDSHSLIIRNKYFCQQSLTHTANYDFFEVFIENYLGIYDKYVRNGLISDNTYRNEKFRLLSRFVMPTYFSIARKRNGLNFGLSRANATILRNYWYEPKFYALPIHILNRAVKNLFSCTHRR